MTAANAEWLGSCAKRDCVDVRNGDLGSPRSVTPHAVADNLLKQDFTASRPNQYWAADITYIATQQSWLFLAVVMDLYSRRIVGWSMDR